MAAAPHENGAAAAGLQTTVVYQRCITRQLRVLDAKIARLELQLNDGMEKISACSELLDEIITKPRSSSLFGLREELDRARAKRDKLCQDFQRKHQQAEIQLGENNNAADGDQLVMAPGALPPAAAAAMTM